MLEAILAIGLSIIVGRLYPERPPSQRISCLPPPEPIPEPEEPEIGDTPIKRSRQSRPLRRMTEFRRDLLDQLEKYQIYIHRMKRGDGRAYRMYKNIGAFILPDLMRMEASGHMLEPGALASLPAFGAFALGIGPGERPDYINIRFVYFMKLARPDVDIELVNTGTTYRCCCYFDNEEALRKEKGGAFAEFAINVAEDGTVTALRVLKTSHQTIHYRGDGGPNGVGANKHLGPAKSRKQLYSATVSHRRWVIPEWAESVVEEHPNQNLYANRNEFLCWAFCICMNFWVQSARGSMVRITATKNALKMPFVVPALDIPSFFKDRDRSDGKRIFHFVRPQKPRRNSKTGRGIKMHTRGQHRFDWNGYRIEITVPGLYSLDLADVTTEGAIEGDEDVNEPLVDYQTFSDAVANRISVPEEIHGRRILNDRHHDPDQRPDVAG